MRKGREKEAGGACRWGVGLGWGWVQVVLPDLSCDRRDERQLDSHLWSSEAFVVEVRDRRLGLGG